MTPAETARPAHRRNTQCEFCDGSGWWQTASGDVACFVCHHALTCPACIEERRKAAEETRR